MLADKLTKIEDKSQSRKQLNKVSNCKPGKVETSTSLKFGLEPKFSESRSSPENAIKYLDSIW
ncbi:capsid assembly protein [Salmonella phage 18-India]|nr:capsid assembly protein [Salmonella phage 18-India]